MGTNPILDVKDGVIEDQRGALWGSAWGVLGCPGEVLAGSLRGPCGLQAERGGMWCMRGR